MVYAIHLSFLSEQKRGMEWMKLVNQHLDKYVLFVLDGKAKKFQINFMIQEIELLQL